MTATKNHEGEPMRVLVDDAIKVGTTVRHRTSGEAGVVADVLVTCDHPDHPGPFGCLAHKFQGCVYVVSHYVVSVGLGRRVEQTPPEIEVA